MIDGEEQNLNSGNSIDFADKSISEDAADLIDRHYYKCWLFDGFF